MAIKLDNLKKIDTIIKSKYGNNLHSMNFIFCFKKNVNSYFIFQEIQGMPIKRVVHHESNNSVTFVASWSSWSNPYAMVADANCDEIEVWKDIQDRSRPYNSYINSTGGFNQDEWKSVSRKNKTEKKKKHKNKSDTFVEFRFDKIQRVNFNEWGFEIYSPTISMISFMNRSFFPYAIQDIPTNALPISLYESLDEVFTSTDDISVNKVSWQGGSFNVPVSDQKEESSITTSNQFPSQPVWARNYHSSSYWDANESDDMFDEEMADILLNNKKEDNTIFDVGQKKVDLDF